MRSHTNLTSRMATLLGRLRREMNGAVVESMQRAGVKGMLNYGVSIPTIRSIAADEGCDHPFACYLYRQQVRELRLAACTIADPKALMAEEIDLWLDGSSSWEILDEVAQRLFSRADETFVRALAARYLSMENPRGCYLAVRTLIRTAQPAPEEVWPRLLALLEAMPEVGPVAQAILAYGSMRLMRFDPQSLPTTPAGDFVRRELAALLGE